MATIGRLAIDLMARTQSLEQGLRTAGNRTSQFAHRANRDLAGIKPPAEGLFSGGLISGLGKITVAAYGAKAAFDFFGSAAADSLQAQKAERKLEQVFKSTGHAARLAADDVKRFASERQEITNFGDDVTIGAAAILGSFTNIKGGVFYEALTSAQDLAAFLDQDLNTSVIQIGKALNDPIRGIGSLSRAGIQFSEDQKKMIKSLVETGDTAKAQALILKELQTQFGGQAEAMRDGVSQLKNAWGDFKEELGKPVNFVAENALTPLVKTLGQATTALNEFGTAYKDVIGGLSFDLGLSDAFGGDSTILNKLAEVASDLTGQNVVPKGGGKFASKDFANGIAGAIADAKKAAEESKPQAKVDVPAEPIAPKKTSPISGVGAIETSSAEAYNALQRAIHEQSNESLEVEKDQLNEMEDMVSELKQIRRAVDRPQMEVEFA